MNITISHIASDSAKDAEKDKNRKDALGAFMQFPNYVKMYETLKSSNAAYKVLRR